MTSITLRADCAQCDALCCVAHAFDRSALFAIDKAAGTPCPHLGVDSRCAIHAGRAARGFAGCVSYDCFGAGQRVTRLFAGRSWRDGAEAARMVCEAFSVMRRAHELIVLLQAAQRLSLRQADEQTCDRLLARLDADVWALAPRAFARAGVEAEVIDFLASLRRQVANR